MTLLKKKGKRDPIAWKESNDDKFDEYLTEGSVTNIAFLKLSI